MLIRIELFCGERMFIFIDFLDNILDFITRFIWSSDVGKDKVGIIWKDIMIFNFNNFNYFLRRFNRTANTLFFICSKGVFLGRFLGIINFLKCFRVIIV